MRVFAIRILLCYIPINMTERDVWNGEQLKLEYRIRQLCESAEVSEMDGVEASKFPIDNISYYPSSRDKSYWARELRYAVTRNLQYPPKPPLTHTNTEGNAIIFKKGDLWLVQMTIESVRDPRNPQISLRVIPKEALHPNVHEVKGCNPGRLFGHIYTTDKQGSSWSIHVRKPVNIQTETPIKEVGAQGTLIRI